MRGMAKADFYTALFLMVFGIGVAEESWRMPRFADLGQSIWSSPGITPGMIGIVLAIMGAVLFFRSRRALQSLPESRVAVDEGSDSSERSGWWRAALKLLLRFINATGDKAGWMRAGYTLLLCFAFGIGLVGRIPFQLASFLFMLAFIVSFDFYDNRDAYRDRLRMVRRVVVAAVISGAAAWAISKVFQDIFFVRLP